MTRLQRWILWLLRQSHRWERLACVFIGRARYQAMKDWCWQIYLRESLGGRDRRADQRDAKTDKDRRAQSAGRDGNR